MDLLSMHTVLRRLTGEFKVALDYEAMLEVQYRKVIGGGATVIDAGAHAGRHTRIFSELCGPSGQVIAVEPLPAQAQALRGLGLSNVSVIEAAISDRSGMASFVHAQGTPEESGLKARVFNFPEWAEPCEIEVELRTLDQIAGPMRRCDYIKMDLEGGELNALNGGTETLTRFRPLVSVEHGVAGYAAYGHGPDDIRAFGERHGYIMADLLGMPAQTKEDWLLISGGWMWDFFMVPAERAGMMLQALQNG